MPILDDFRDHDLFGPVMLEAERRLLTKQMNKRFGPVPGWVSERIGQLGTEELEELGLRFLDVQSLEELFRAD